MVLKQLVGSDHIDILSRHNSKFNFGKLKKDDHSPYVLVMDDFRWQQTGMYVADFLNLLDGNLVNTENKFEVFVLCNQRGTTEGKESRNFLLFFF